MSGGTQPRVRKGQILAWASWDWGSAAFNAVMTTFVFTVYLTSESFGGEAHASSVLGLGIALAGVAVAVLAPVVGQRSDAGGRRRMWLGINTALVCLTTALCFFVLPRPEFLLLDVGLIALGNIFNEFAGVNYNAMLSQISTPATVGRVSGFGWAMGYVGGIAALAAVLVGFINPDVGWFGVTSENGLNIRAVALFAAVWLAVFALPVMFAVPEVPRSASWPPTACSSAGSRRFSGPARTRCGSCWPAPSSATASRRSSLSAASLPPAPLAGSSPR